MTVQNTVARYREYLQQHNPDKYRFNIWAFAFNSFYFLANKMWIPALLIMASQLILLSTAEYAQMSAGKSLLLVWGLPGLVSGLFGYKWLYRSMKRYIEDNQATDLSLPVNFAYIPLWRFALLTVLSFGTYYLFWCYIQWQAFRRDTKYYSISPLLRSFWLGLFIWPLLYRIKKNAPKPQKLTRWYTPIYLITATAFLTSGLVLVFNLFLYIAFLLIAFAGLLAVQYQINRQTSYRPGNRELLRGEVLTVVAGCLLMALSTFVLNKDFKDLHLMEATHISYMYMVEIEEQCLADGYEMTATPEAFAAEYSDELALLDEAWRRRSGKSLSQIWANYPPNSKAAVAQMARYQLDRLQDVLRQNADAASQESVEDMGAVCAAADRMLPEVFKNQQIKTDIRGLLQDAGALQQ